MGCLLFFLDKLGERAGLRPRAPKRLLPGLIRFDKNTTIYGEYMLTEKA